MAGGLSLQLSDVGEVFIFLWPFSTFPVTPSGSVPSLPLKPPSTSRRIESTEASVLKTQGSRMQLETLGAELKKTRRRHQQEPVLGSQRRRVNLLPTAQPRSCEPGMSGKSFLKPQSGAHQRPVHVRRPVYVWSPGAHRRPCTCGPPGAHRRPVHVGSPGAHRRPCTCGPPGAHRRPVHVGSPGAHQRPVTQLNIEKNSALCLRITHHRLPGPPRCPPSSPRRRPASRHAALHAPHALQAELKVPLGSLVPGAMNRQGNRRTTKEVSSDLKSQNSALPKTRSWPGVNSTTGPHQTANEPLHDSVSQRLHDSDSERECAAVLDGARGHRGDQDEDDYEEPRAHVAEAWQAVKILPARPIKESEYADTRYFKGMMDTPLPLATKMPIAAEGQTWNTQMRLEGVDQPISKDIRSQHVKGDRPTKINKTPLPPPRPPVVSLPKKYQPLPPEPESGTSPYPQRHTSPEVQSGPRQISLKNLSEVLGTEKVAHHQMKPESSHLSQNQSAPEIPLAVASSSFMMSNHSLQNRDHKEGAPFRPPPRPPSPASTSPRENSLRGRKPFPTKSDEESAPLFTGGVSQDPQWMPKPQTVPNLHLPPLLFPDVQLNEWYIGDYSRRAVEEALMRENQDGTFLVRDCSAKSRAEPYVLVVFYRSRVYNVKIRFLERNCQFALGTGLRGDEKFDSVEDIIEHYKYFPIILVDGKDKTGTRREQCYLARPLPLHRLHCPW
ncbi:cytokine-dependent hematopoietic cell linker [Saccopteryx bilineata]|uniref:cytokine-dependent hematopoietic cell linker n=1 Tax=Saccopteryx bilineata TaxID=59482 RepID=UPI00338E3775